MSGPQIMIVLIVLTVVIGRLVSRGMGYPGWGGPRRVRADGDGEADRLRDEVATLKERLAVLERIATDSGTRLDREIEALRRPEDRPMRRPDDRDDPFRRDRADAREG